MGFIGRFLLGAIILAVGLGAVYFGIDRLPKSDSSAAIDDSAASTPAETKSSSPEEAAAPASGDIGHPANANLRINQSGLTMIEESEGLRLEAYQAGGNWYIGYGHTKDVHAGMTITEAQAEAFLREDVKDFEATVKKVVTVRVNENEFSAMVSLCYNLGGGKFGASSVVSKLNKGDRSGAADAFLEYNKAGGQANDHLTERRQKERALFLTPA